MRRRFVPIEEWKDPRHQRGIRGERLVMGYLRSCGWEIEAHRFRLGRHDVDVIARRGSLVAFVEVKTRHEGDAASALGSVGAEKRRALARCAQAWIARHGRPADAYRFDVVTVIERRGRRPTVEQLADAWRILV